MKTLYPVVALSAALLLAACSEDKPTTETDAAKTTTTEQAAPTEEAVTETQEAVAEEAAPEEQEAVAEEAAPEEQEAVAEEAAPEEQEAVAEEAAPEEQEAVAEEAAPEDEGDVSEEAAPEDEGDVSEEAVTEEQEAASEGDMGSLADLSQYVGKYPNDGVNFLTISPLAERLQDLLGDDFEKFQANMETVGPLSEENGLLYITGNKDNEGGTNAAALVIDPEQDTLFVWNLIDGAGSVVTESEETVTLPADVQTMMDNAKQQ